MSDLFEIVKKTKEENDAKRKALEEKIRVEGTKNFNKLKKLHKEYFFDILRDFFGKDFKWEVVAFDAISYNPSHYSGHKEALPQYMVVSYPAGDDHIAFKLQVKATGQYRMAYVDQFGATTLLSDPGSLWLHIAK